MPTIPTAIVLLSINGPERRRVIEEVKFRLPVVAYLIGGSSDKVLLCHHREYPARAQAQAQAQAQARFMVKRV